MSGAWDGRPANPERDGWHWLRHDNGRVEPEEWLGVDGRYEDELGWNAIPGNAGEAVKRGYQYLGPCLLPEEAAAMRDRRSNAEAQAVREVRAAHEQREVISELQAERDGLDAIIARMQAQDVLAIKQWQAANPGNDLRWPDKMRLTAWCMTEFAKAHAECERLRLGGCARGQTTVQMQAERDEAREMLAQATHDSRGWGDYGASTVTGPRAPSLHTLAQRVEALEHRMRNR